MVIGFTIKLELPEEIKAGFPGLIDKVRRHVIRQAVRSALVTPKNVLKTKLMGLRTTSRQSSGATFRAITTKYRNSRSDPDRFYGLVGVDRKAFETILPESSPVYRNAKHRQVNWGSVINHRADGSPVFAKRNPRRDVRSYFKRNIGGPKKRIPKYYLHLWERGYNSSDKGPVIGSRYRRFAGHHFIQKTYEETQAQVLETFKARVVELFTKAAMQ